MAPQDYVSRPRANAKKSNPYNKKAANQQLDNGHKKKAAAVTLFFLLAAVGYGLWLLKTSDATKNPSALVKTSTNSKEKTVLPPPPKSKWSYINGLKTKEVEVGNYEVVNRGPFKMQCGSFRTQAQANTLKAQIAFVGLEAIVKKATGSKGVWYKVYLGPYAKKRLAEKDKHQLKNNKINHCAIWLWK